MEQVELVSVEASDGVRLDGTFSRADKEPTLGVDLVIFHHGRGTNFYNPSMAQGLTESLLERGMLRPSSQQPRSRSRLPDPPGLARLGL